MSGKDHELTEQLKSDHADFQNGYMNQKEYDQRRKQVIRDLKAHNKQRYGFAMGRTSTN